MSPSDPELELAQDHADAELAELEAELEASSDRAELLAAVLERAGSFLLAAARDALALVAPRAATLLEVKGGDKAAELLAELARRELQELLARARKG